NLIASLNISDADATAMLQQALGQRASGTGMDSLLGEALGEFTPGSILEGRIIGFSGDFVVVDVGLKSEGMIQKDEFDNLAELKVGDKVKVLLEELDGEEGVIQLSKRKADRMLNWQRIIDTTREGDVVEGRVMRKIKGGLLVDIGVPVFLPASQVDVRRP